MRSLCYLVVVVTILLGGSGRAYAQNATLADDLLADWQQQKAMMMAIAEAMPEETYGFKPTEAQRTYAEQILHIAGANVFLMQHVGGGRSAVAGECDPCADGLLHAESCDGYLRSNGRVS